MKMRLFGLGLGALLTLAGVTVPSVTAYADSTCYTGCTPTTPNGSPPVVKTSDITDAVSGGALAFTGADIEEMVAIGAGAVFVGGVLVRRSRTRRRTTA